MTEQIIELFEYVFFTIWQKWDNKEPTLLGLYSLNEIADQGAEQILIKC